MGITLSLCRKPIKQTPSLVIPAPAVEETDPAEPITPIVETVDETVDHSEAVSRLAASVSEAGLAVASTIRHPSPPRASMDRLRGRCSVCKKSMRGVSHASCRE